MISLKKDNKSFDVTGLMKLFIIAIFIACPFYFGYHHFIMKDMFLITKGTVIEKTNYKNSDGKYVYELNVAIGDNTNTTITVDADEYIHTEINQTRDINVFNKEKMNPIMTIVGMIEVVVLVLALLFIVGAAMVA